MKCFIRVFLFFSIFLLISGCRTDSIYRKPQLIIKQHSAESDLLSHYLYVPAENKNQPLYPLLVILHGAGGTGATVSPQLAFNTPLHPLYGNLVEGEPPDRESLSELDPFIRDSIVLIPATQNSWEPEELNNLIEEIMLTYPVDRNALYISGWSMGGWGSWDYSSAYPEKVAALVPICGGNKANPELRDKSIWMFHDFADPVVRADTSQELIISKMMEIQKNEEGSFLFYSDYPFKNGDSRLPAEDVYTLNLDEWKIGKWIKGTVLPVGSVRYTVTNWGSHSISGRVYANPELWEWLYSQRLNR